MSCVASGAIDVAPTGVAPGTFESIRSSDASWTFSGFGAGGIGGFLLDKVWGKTGYLYKSYVCNIPIVCDVCMMFTYIYLIKHQPHVKKM